MKYLVSSLDMCEHCSGVTNHYLLSPAVEEWPDTDHGTHCSDLWPTHSSYNGLKYFNCHLTLPLISDISWKNNFKPHHLKVTPDSVWGKLFNFLWDSPDQEMFILNNFLYLEDSQETVNFTDLKDTKVGRGNTKIVANSKHLKFLFQLLSLPLSLELSMNYYINQLSFKAWADDWQVVKAGYKCLNLSSTLLACRNTFSYKMRTKKG